jgi:formylmethanofuran dehydrogenase subunit E
MLALLFVCLTIPGDPSPDPAAVAECLARVKEIHGGAGPWAVVGYRMGLRAATDLGLPRQSFALEVVHRCPAEVQYSCMADGLQAATGASVGKLNLKVEAAEVAQLRTTVKDRKSGRTLTFTLRPELASTIRDLPYERLEAEGKRVAGLADDAIFVVEDSRKPSAR